MHSSACHSARKGMWYRLCALSFSGVLCPAPYLAFPVKTFGVRGEGADPLRRPPQLFSFPLRKRTFRWRAPWEVRVGGSSLFLDLCLQEVSLGRCHPCPEQKAWNIQVSDWFLPTPSRQ